MSCHSINTIDIQGHRGCRGLLPENSLPAFEKAIDLGVHTLEMDLAVSKDNQVIVSHEPFMSRKICLKPNGNSIPESEDMQHNLYKMTVAEIQQYDCGKKLHPDYPEQEKVKVYKPTLSEVITMAEAKNPKIKYNLEIKAKPKFDGVYTPKPNEFVRLVIAVLKKHDIVERTNLQSFDLRILEDIKKQNKTIEVALLVNDNETIASKLSRLSYTPEIISPYFQLLTPEKVAKFQKNDFKMIPWTVNTIDDMQRMLDYQVDGIITDFPNTLVEVLQK